MNLRLIRRSRIVSKPEKQPHTSVAAVRCIGFVLVGVALSLPAFESVAFSFHVRTLSILLLAISGLIALAILNIANGLTSLIGLFFLTTLVFNLGRPILWLFLQDDRVYELYFGRVGLGSSEFATVRLLMFWCMCIGGFFGGYLLLLKDRPLPAFALSARTHKFCRQCFFVSLFVLAAIVPATLLSNIHTFSAGGYSALYAGQTTYRFSWLRLADFVLPVLFAFGALLRQPRYARLVTVAVSMYLLTGLVVGERAAAGQWILTGIWYLTQVIGKKIHPVRLVCSAAVLITLFQFLVGWREGYSSSFTLVQFLTDQGITFLLPELTQVIPHLPVHTALGSFFPLGAIYSWLHIGSPETRSMGNYLGSQVDIVHFEQGAGLGGNFYMELYYVCGGMMPLLAAACALCGLLLRKWEEAASSHAGRFFIFCISVPSILFLPRGTVASVTSALIYGTVFVFLSFLILRVLNAAAREAPAAGICKIRQGGQEAVLPPCNQSI